MHPGAVSSPIGETRSTAHVAVIGAGPAGATAARILAQGGTSVLLFDHRAPWEKPCGGIIPLKTLAANPVLNDYPSEKNQYGGITHIAPDCSEIFQEHPGSFSVVSREELGAFLLERAVSAGTRFVPTRVQGISRKKRSWLIEAGGKSFGADFIIGADGAYSLVRRIAAGEIPTDHMALTCGYFLEGIPPDECVMKFADVHGYLWKVSCARHASLGIMSRRGDFSAGELLALLDSFIASRFPGARAIHKWGALLPSAISPEFFDAPACGDGWALAGDAAGHVDPLLGEGIHYAFSSGAHLARAILDGRPARYDDDWRDDYGRALARKAAVNAEVACLAREFGRARGGEFLFHYFTGDESSVRGRSFAFGSPVRDATLDGTEAALNRAVFSLCRRLPASAQTAGTLFLMSRMGMALGGDSGFFGRFYRPAWSVLAHIASRDTAVKDPGADLLESASGAHAMAMMLHLLDDHLNDGDIAASHTALLVRSEAWRFMLELWERAGSDVPGGPEVVRSGVDAYYSAMLSPAPAGTIDEYCARFEGQMATWLVSPVLVARMTGADHAFEETLRVAYTQFGIAWRLLDDVQDTDPDMERGARAAVYCALSAEGRSLWDECASVPEDRRPVARARCYELMEAERVTSFLLREVCAHLERASTAAASIGLHAFAAECRALASPLADRFSAATGTVSR